MHFDRFQLDAENVYDVLEAAEMFLLPDLKRQCGAFLGSFIELENAVDLLQTARLFSIPRLEQLCIEFMANNVEDLVADVKFRSIVEQDALSVVGRQETDSVDIIDEMRFILRTTIASQVAKPKLDSLSRMLEDLGLDI